MDVGEAREVAEVKVREKRSTKMSKKKVFFFFLTGMELDPSARLVFLFGIGMIILFDFCFNEEFFSTSTDILLGNTLAKFSSFRPDDPTRRIFLVEPQLAQPVTKC